MDTGSLVAPHPLLYRSLVERALLEDLGTGDITTEATVGAGSRGRACIVAKEPGVMAGGFVGREVFHLVDPDLEVELKAEEGAGIRPGDLVLEVQGNVASILMAERTVLNFLQHLCGVATLSRAFAGQVAGSWCRVADTRKTTPGMRVLAQYAVSAGGRGNHRMDLSSGVLIKDNHIAACGSVGEAVRRARARVPHGLKIQVEVSSLEGLRAAVEAGADAVLLDNMDTSLLEQAVALARGLSPGILLEASGGITLENVGAVAATGVDIISSGALTHSAKAVDLSLRLM